MAAPRLISQAQSATSAAATALSATLPASIGTTQSNVLFAVVAIDGAQTSVTASGWTLLGRTVYSSGSLSATLAVLMKAASTSSNTCTLTWSTSGHAAASILQYADCATSTSTMFWQAATSAGNTTADPPSASAEVSFSSYASLACISMANSTVTISSYPSNSTGGVTVAAGSGNTGARLGVAQGPVVTQTADPTAFTLSTTNYGVVGTLLFAGVSGAGTGGTGVTRKRGSFQHLVGAA